MQEIQLSLSEEFEYNPNLETEKLTDQWYTPESIIQKVTDFFGGTIDLDPASCAEANKTVNASLYFDERSNGLKQDWHGNVFCNPPYSTPLIGEFCEKVVEQYNSGNINSAIYLLKEGATTAWFRPLRPYLTAYIDKRVKFTCGITGKVCESPRSGHCLVYLGPDKNRFINAFTDNDFCYFPNINN